MVKKEGAFIIIEGQRQQYDTNKEERNQGQRVIPMNECLDHSLWRQAERKQTSNYEQH
jgi:hypothetical protein